MKERQNNSRSPTELAVRNIPRFRFYGFVLCSAAGVFGSTFVFFLLFDFLKRSDNVYEVLVTLTAGLASLYALLFLPFRGKLPYLHADSERFKLTVHPIFSSKLIRLIYFSRVFGVSHLKAAILYMETQDFTWKEIKRIELKKKNLAYQVRIITNQSKGFVIFMSFRRKSAQTVRAQLLAFKAARHQ